LSDYDLGVFTGARNQTQAAFKTGILTLQFKYNNTINKSRQTHAQGQAQEQPKSNTHRVGLKKDKI